VSEKTAIFFSKPNRVRNQQPFTADSYSRQYGSNTTPFKMIGRSGDSKECYLQTAGFDLIATIYSKVDTYCFVDFRPRVETSIDYRL